MYRLSIKDLLERFNSGTMTCEAYARRLVQRANDLKAFNFFVSMDTDRLLQEAREADGRYKSKTNRPLEGIPIAMKDNIDIEGEVTGASTPGLAGLKPKHTAEVAKRLFDAGAIYAGRTNMHELASGVSTNNSYTGTCHNFHNFDYTCGGSSGGSAGAVSADIVPASLGTDTAGSIRIPSSYSGVFGLRPTSVRWPSNYGVKMTHLRDSVGPLARSAEDIAILDSVMTGEMVHPELDPSEIRIGIPKAFFWESLSSEVEEYAYKFLSELKLKGFAVVEIGEIPGAQEMREKYFLPTIHHEMIPRLEEYLNYHGHHHITAHEVIQKIASPDVKPLIEYMLENPPKDDIIKSAMLARDKLIKDFREIFEKEHLDCILMPANKIPPPMLSEFDLENAKLMAHIVDNDDLAGICNNPSVVIPGGFTREGGVPFGMQIEGPTGTDSRIIAVARAIKKVLKF